MASHKLVVDEKPSVARDLARVLGAKTRGNGCLTGNGYVVTWCLGHLVGIALPEIQNPGWKKWSLDTLPIILDSFKHSVLKDSAEKFHIVSEMSPTINDFWLATKICTKGMTAGTQVSI